MDTVTSSQAREQLASLRPSVPRTPGLAVQAIVLLPRKDCCLGSKGRVCSIPEVGAPVLQSESQEHRRWQEPTVRGPWWRLLA